MYKTVIFDAFEADLDSALTYIETELFNAGAATNLLDRSEETVARIVRTRLCTHSITTRTLPLAGIATLLSGIS